MPLSRTDLSNRVDAISNIFKTILNDDITWNNLGNDKQQQLITGINKSYGQAMSFLHEYMTTNKAILKSRKFITQTHADVTVGEIDKWFTKSIECKSVTKPEKGAVNSMIAKAVEQLGEQTGHQPREGDVRVVDVNIDGQYNPWPIAGGSYNYCRANASLANIKTDAVNELKGIITSGKPGAKFILNWLSGETLTNFQALSRLNKFTDFPHSSRPIYQDTSGYYHKIRCITFKIRYLPGYILTDPMPLNEFKCLDEIIVQCYKKAVGDNMIIEVAKLKTSVFNMLDNSSTTNREYL